MVRLRERDRNEAVRFVDRAEEELRELETAPNRGFEVRLEGSGGSGAEGFRLFYRVRDDSVWVLGMCSTGE